MKKIYIFFLVLFLSSCFFSQKEDVENAKKELWVTKTEVWEKVDLDVDLDKKDEDLEENIDDSSKNEENNKESKSSYEVKNLGSEKFLELDELDVTDFVWWGLKITWKTLVKVDKITVKFSNKTSDFPDDDDYVLTKFKSWDETFEYNAFSKYEVFDFWENVYKIIAYSWDKEAELELKINNIKEEKKEEKEEGATTDVGAWKIELWDLPKVEWFWDSVKLGEWIMSYSNVDWLEIRKWDTSDLDCGNVSDYLNKKILTYKWWNTCIPISKDKWLSVFVVRISGSKYFYEKHYFLGNKLMHWVYELESWDFDTSEDKLEFVKTKNAELKLKNADFESIDSLFKELVK